LETIAHEGPSALYGGRLGAAIAAHLAGLGAAMTPDDLASHEPERDSPLILRYRDLDVGVAPPNSQGFALLESLATIERLAIDPDPLGPDAGTLAEIFRVAGADRDRHNADPRRSAVPVGTLLGENHLADIVDRVCERSSAPTARRRGDTIALVAADASGLGIVLIQSLFDSFGSGILEPSTGVVLHNRGSAFVLDPGHPNVLAGGKRPAHTLLPVVVQRGGRLVALAGTMGGGGQPQIDAMSLIRALELGMGAAEAVAAPRWLVGGMALGSAERALVAESSVPAPARRSLEAAGYRIETVGELDGAVGHAHLLLAQEDGDLEVGSDPRADGGAAVR
ncbi:MAG: gamma-glutamyltransferase, partial [Actinomycetota bacterium]